MTTATIRPATRDDAAALAAIYNHYVRDTVVTFEEEPVAAGEMASRVDGVQAHGRWLVAEEGDRLLGYAYASAWKPRSAYRYAAESTVYLAPDAIGRGVGSQLYGALLPQLQQDGIHCVIGGIALPNAASVALHEKCGFRKVAQFHEVGFKFGRWVDVGYWERLLRAGPAGRT